MSQRPQTSDSQLHTGNSALTRKSSLRNSQSHPQSKKILVKSLSREVAKEIELTPASPAPTSLRAKRTAERMAKSGKWVESLRCSDVSRLWSELHRIVSHHPLVRASRSAGLLVEEGASSYTDLTQELFVQL